MKPVDRELEEAIRDLLGRTTGTICPSEAAKKVGGTDSEDAWRELMEPARRAARRLVAEGEVEITQQGGSWTRRRPRGRSASAAPPEPET